MSRWIIRCWTIALAGIWTTGSLSAVEQRSLAQLQSILWDNPEEAPMTEMLAALRHAAQLKNEEGFPGFSLVFSGACRYGRAGHWPELLEIFEEIPGDSSYKSMLFVPLADLWLRLRVETMSFPRVREMGGKVPMPETVAQLPKNLQAAWRKFQSLAPMVPYSVGGDGESIRSFQANEETYWKLVGDLLAGRGSNWSKELRNYGWGGTCGTGSEIFAMPQSRALLLAYIAENQMKKAVTASLTLPQDMLGLGQAENTGPLLFLSKADIAWPEAMIGGLVEADLAKGENRYGFYAQRPQWLLSLASEGDDQAAELMLEIARRVPAEERNEYVRALAMFVEPAKPRAKYRMPGEAFRSPENPIAPAVQEKILAFFEGEVAEQTSMDELGALMFVFETLDRPETKSALRKMVNLPSQSLAERAARTLGEMGEVVDMPPKVDRKSVV